MGKKNRFVFNIGFNQMNPDHERVADILNLLGHGKAEYLTKAVLFYEENRNNTSLSIPQMDYQQIEDIVRKILAEQKPDTGRELSASHLSKDQKGNDGREEIEETDMQNVLEALGSFRKGGMF